MGVMTEHLNMVTAPISNHQHPHLELCTRVCRYLKKAAGRGKTAYTEVRALATPSIRDVLAGSTAGSRVSEADQGAAICGLLVTDATHGHQQCCWLAASTAHSTKGALVAVARHLTPCFCAAGLQSFLQDRSWRQLRRYAIHGWRSLEPE